MKILLVEDEKKLAQSLKKGLQEVSCTVDEASNGDDGLYLAGSGSYDAVILDIQLPGLSGLEVLKRLREKNIQTPVLFLTARGSVQEKVQGLNLGADDYLVKPFSFSELLARLHAIRRRKSGQVQPSLDAGGLTLNLLTREVIRNGRKIDLRPKEFSILQMLLENKGRVVTRTLLLEQVWDYAFLSASNVIDVHMKRLREKVDQPGEPPLIKTIKGVGYCIE